MNSFFNDDYIEIVIKNGILFFTYLPIGVFNENVAQQIVAARLQLQRERAYPILCDIRQFSLPTKKARKYLAMEGSLLTTAVAYWVRPHGGQNLMRFFIDVNHPIIPTAIFTQREEALTYLKTFVHEH